MNPLPPHLLARVKELAVKQREEKFSWLSYGLFYIYSQLLQEAAKCRQIVDVQHAYWYWDGIPWNNDRAVFTEILEHYESCVLYDASYLSFYGRI